MSRLPSWHSHLIEWARVLEPVAEDFWPLEVRPPVTPAECAEIEAALGRPLPASLRRFALEEASAIEFGWHLPDDGDQSPWQGPPWGGMEFDIFDLPHAEEHRRGWVAQVFPNRDDPYDARWHDALALYSISNGDMIAIDFTEPHADPPVVYLSHEGGSGHGVRLGHTFADFLVRFTRLGCPGPEDWEIEPLLTGTPPMLDPSCAAARRWRTRFNLPL